MPSYPHIPTGLPTVLPKRLFKAATRKHLRAACAGEPFGPRYPVSAERCREPGIWQWLIAKLPWGYITRVSAWVKGLHLEFGRNKDGANS